MANSPFSLFKPELIQEIAEQASKILPNEKSRDELHKSVQLIVQNALGKLDIVTREEFDAQKAVLEKTRTKVENLEKELAELKQELDNK